MVLAVVKQDNNDEPEVNRRMEEVMSNGNVIKQATEKFVSELVELMEKAVQQRIQEKLVGIAGSLGGTRAVVKSKVNAMRVPCPVDGCKLMAVPRNGMVCDEHKGLSSDKKLLLRTAAKKPDGIWTKYKAKQVEAGSSSKPVAAKRGRAKKSA